MAFRKQRLANRKTLGRTDLVAYRELNRVLSRYEPRVAAAFLTAVESVKNKLVFSEVIAALQARDIKRAVNLIDPQVMASAMLGAGLQQGRKSVVNRITEVFVEGGSAGVKQLPRDIAIEASLDLTNPRAVAYLKRVLPRMVKEVSNQTRKAIRVAILNGFQQGRPLATIARDIRSSIGLTAKQTQYLVNFRTQLETGQVAGFTPPWDRRLSAAEQQQVKSIYMMGGETSKRVDGLVARYEQSLVNRRAMNIARTEAHNAHIAGQQELWQQAEDQGLLMPGRTKRHWIVTPDDRLRHSHATVPGLNPSGVGLNQPFKTAIGPVMNPGMSGNPEFDINCRCAVALEIG